MEEVPERVRERAESLTEERGRAVAAKRIGSRYYAYECAGQLDKETGKMSSFNHYLGKILDDGTFIGARRRTDRSNMAQRLALRELSGPMRSAAETILSERKGLRMMLDKGVAHLYDASGDVPKYYGRIGADGAFHGAEELGRTIRQDDAAEAYNDFNEHDAKILTILSMNGRATAKFIADRIGLSEAAAYGRIKRLEERFGIRYMAEFDIEDLGLFASYIAFVRFDGRRPTEQEMREAVEAEPKVQYAAITKGEFDMVLYIFDTNSGAASDTIWRLRSESPLRRYSAEWYVSPIAKNFGYVPFRDELFGGVMEGMAWRRTREAPRPARGQLTQREFQVMRELSRDGRADFSEIDRKHGMSQGSAQYAYRRLRKRGVICRTTMTMEKLPMRYTAIILLKDTVGAEFKETYAEYLKELMSCSNAANRYALQGYMGAPTGSAIFMPVSDERELDAALDFFGTRIKGAKTSALIVTTVLVGRICYRRFDTAHSRYQRILHERHGFPALEKIDYEESPRKLKDRTNTTATRPD